MTLYVDSSALLKRYVDERDSAFAEQAMGDDPVLVTSRITEIEVRRNLARLLDGDELLVAQRAFDADIDHFALVEVDAVTCAEAARLAEQTLCRSLDAVHLACARRAGVRTVVLTFDRRQARAARAIGLEVIGA